MTTSTALARIEFGPQDIEQIKAGIMPKDGTTAELSHFVAVCRHLGLDPFARQIYAIRRGPGRPLTIQIAVDGYRSLAETTGEYEGQTAPEWCGEDGHWVDVWLKPVLPAAARVGVYRRGFRDAVYGIALMREFAQGTDTWKSMPTHMLAKVAEVAALKRAFPQVFLEVRQHARAEAVEVADDAAIEAEVTEVGGSDSASTNETPKSEPPKPKPGPAVAQSVAPETDGRREAEAAWKRWKALCDEHGWSPLRLRYYLGQPNAAAVTGTMLLDWKAAHPDHGYDTLLTLAIEGETAAQQAAAAVTAEPEQAAMEVE